VKAGLDRDGDDGGQLSDARWIVLLHPHESPQDVVEVAGPAEHMGVLQPAGDVGLGQRNTSESHVRTNTNTAFI